MSFTHKSVFPVLYILSTLVRADEPLWKTDRNIRGVSYAPTPRGLNPDFTEILLAKDMFNSDFQAIWGIDGRDGVVSRNDLQVMRDAGINSLHLYGWDARSTVRNHRPFLDYCQQVGMRVWIPISDAFLDWANHEPIARGVVDTTRLDDGSIHPAVYGWMVSNEYDLGGIPIAQIVQVINIIADADPGNERPFSVPVSTQVNYNGDARPGMGALIELHDNLPAEIFNDRFIHSINPFFPFDPIQEQILEPYRSQFEDVWGMSPIPIMMGESGRSSDEVGLDEMTNEFTGMACGFLGLMEFDNPYNFMGFFFFEFTEEDWKGAPDQFYGLHSLGDTISPNVPPTTVMVAPGTSYEVNQLFAVPAWDNIVSILATGPKNNGLCNGRTGGASVDTSSDAAGSMLIAGICFLGAISLIACCAVKWNARHRKPIQGGVVEMEMNSTEYAYLEADKEVP